MDILAPVGPIEIRDFAALVNKCRLVEEYNKKLKTAQSDVYGKRIAPDGQEARYTPPPKKQFPPSEYESKQPQRPIVGRECPKCEKYHGGRPCLAR